MSSPTTSPRTTPKRNSRRTTPKRSPLQERTPSQKNEAAGRLHRESKPELTDAEIFIATPFPTKPQHVLLPSTVRKQRSRQNVENEIPSLFFNRAQPDAPSSVAGAHSRQDERRVRRAPKIQLKKSVTALRDMYEAQADSSRPSTAVPSRPSTAAPSPAMRPTSSRLRSISSSDGLSGRSAWEMLGLPKVSVDDIAMLPTLSEDMQSLNSEHSFASRVRHHGGSSSPNFRTLGTSSPGLPSFHDVATSSDPVEGSSSSGLQMTGLTSPNFVQFHQSSSMMTADPTPSSLRTKEPESSPNIVKLGTSSPRRSSSPTPSEASTVSRKRKRPDIEGSAYAGRTPLFFGRDRVQSSPPLQTVPASSEASLQSASRVLPSSPPEAESIRSTSQPTSSPVFRMPTARFSTDRSSITSAHTNLQSVLSSSPGPPIHRPIVRAPDFNQFENLALQKRNTSGPAKLEASAQKLSPVTSVADFEIPQLSSPEFDQFQDPRRSASRVSVFTEELEDNLDTESMAPAHAYMLHHDLNSSQVHMISDAADHHEATDELGALPPREHSSFAAALSQARNGGYLSSSSSSNSLSRYESFRTSMDGRLQSMRSFTHGRNDSFRSSYRPESSGSYTSQSVVPTWARKYYSGFYQNSFQYLYQSSNNLGYPVIEVRPSSRRASMPASIPASSSYETISSTSNIRRSLSRSVRSSIKSFRLSLPLPTTRPRLNVRQSHITAGIGPLVSNPVRPHSEMLSRPQSAYQNRHTIRRVSAPITAVDPRYHWNGIIEEPETAEEAEKLDDHEYTGSPRYADPTNAQPPFSPGRNSFRFPPRLMRLPSPHLHHDRILHSGSSASQGFGAPYNARPKWQPSVGFNDEIGRPSWFKVDLKDFQVICFMAGFVFPPTWFLAALTPLPVRPTNYHDLEKMEAGNYPGNQQMADGWSQTDIVARLRLEKHIRGLEEVKWQNARWWRRMNRWMCCVGVVILIVVIVLAVIGTKNWA